MNEEKQKEYLEFAKRVAIKSGKIMKEYFYHQNDYSYKEDRTIVTEVDKKINRLVIEEVKKRFPTHAIDGEEEQSGKSKYTWVCDPIDGTAMYQRHIPTSVFSLALVVDGIPIVGVVYDPYLHDLYYASKGQGAYQNEKPIHVNNIQLDDKESLVQCDMWPTAEYNLYKIQNEIGKRAYTVAIGSTIRAGVGVAKGDFSLVLFPGTKGKNCDIAALKIIVEEAGGKVSNLFGEEERYDQDIHGAIISNAIIHPEVVEIVKKYIVNEK